MEQLLLTGGSCNVDISTRLVERAKSGDIAAMDQVICEWYPSVINFLIRLSGNREIAQDMCQDTFVLVTQHLGQLADSAKFRAWLFQIAHNQFRSHMRRSQNAWSIDAFGYAHLGGAKLTGSGDRIEDPVGLEIRQQIIDVLFQMSTDQRAVLLLRHVVGLSIAEIAVMQGLPKPSLQRRLNRAEQRFRSLYVDFDVS